VSAGRVVLAAGAWSASIPGVPHTLPVEPVRGQMLSVGTAPLGHVIYGGGGYVVPRGRNLTVVGSTMERVGFETGTTADAIASLERVASRVCPVLGKAPTIDRWSGFRPVTPDLLPILGADPEQPSLIYACGHSRNGILLGPLSGECAAALAVGEDPPVDVSPFAVSRFRSDS
jgi:glycine oxidase